MLDTALEGITESDLLIEIERLKIENESLKEESVFHQDKAVALERDIQRLENRFGLVWPHQKEHFLKVVSDTEIVYKNKLWTKSGKVSSSKGSKAEVEFDGGDFISLVRGNEPYLYTDKTSHKEYLCQGGHAYKLFKDIVGKYLPTLVPKSGCDKDWGFDDKNGERKHILIEGDNYHALQVLQHTHRGAVDVIYIDPPYNTGNKDFKYNDKFVSDEDGSRHSSWLSFMERRLMLAKNLLANDGVLFVSIDDVEQHYLTSLCDNIFGESNRAGVIHWKKNRKPHNASKTMATSVEYILVYYKKDKIKLCRDFEDDKSDVRGSFNVYPIFKSDKKERSYILPSGVFVEGGKLKAGKVNAGRNSRLDIRIDGDTSLDKDNRTINDITVTGRFCLTDERGRLTEALLKDTIYFNKGSIPKEKRYRSAGDAKVEVNLWDISGGTNEDGLSELLQLLPHQEAFSYPKPKALINRILKSLKKDNLVVLDFFAGSGTTGHAVWELNKEDSGNRQVILCTNNESNICEDVTYERMRRCNLPEHGDYQEGLEYLQVRHVSAEEFRQADRTKSLDHIKHIINLRHNASKFIEDNDKWYATNTICVLKNPRYVDEFFEKFKSHSTFALVDNKSTKFQIFKERAASYGISPYKLHWLSKEYISDLLLSASVED